MRHAFRKTFLLALLSASVFGVAASAQERPQQSPPPVDRQESTPQAGVTTPKAAESMPIDEQKIDKFAEAYVAVQTIQTKAAKDLDSASNDPTKQQQTQAAVENEMIAAVERTGLKLEEFNGIVQSMTADADLRAKVVAKIRERTGG